MKNPIQTAINDLLATECNITDPTYGVKEAMRKFYGSYTNCVTFAFDDSPESHQTKEQIKKIVGAIGGDFVAQEYGIWHWIWETDMVNVHEPKWWQA